MTNNDTAIKAIRNDYALIFELLHDDFVSFAFSKPRSLAVNELIETEFRSRVFMELTLLLSSHHTSPDHIGRELDREMAKDDFAYAIRVLHSFMPELKVPALLP